MSIFIQFINVFEVWKKGPSPPIFNYAFSAKDTLVRSRQIKDEFREKEYLLNLTLQILILISK